MRNGKIATLPSSIRDELNWRMENGEQGNDLLAWLNGLPEVQERIHGSHDGAPISKQNLSEWRLGGFREWHLHHELMRDACRLSEHAGLMEEAVDAPLLAGKMTAILAARYAALLNSWDGAPSPEFEEKLRVLRGLNRDLALLQKILQQASRQENEYFQHGEDEMEKRREKRKELAMAPIQARLERSSMQGLFELFFPCAEAGRLAELATAIKFNLPLPKKGRKTPTRQTGSKRGRLGEASLPCEGEPDGQTGSKRGRLGEASLPCEGEPDGQTESNPVKPSQSEDGGLPSRGRDASPRRPALKPGQTEDSGLTVNPGRDPFGQDESNPGRLGEASLPCESEPDGQTESNPVKASQSEKTGLTVKAECADGVLESAT